MNELLAKNQANLQGLHADMKQVSKIAGETTVNIRKINNPGTRKAAKTTFNDENSQNNQIDSRSRKNKHDG